MNISKEDYNKIIKYCFSGSSHDFIYYKSGDGKFYYNFNRLILSD
jgi:hypothetical protein